MDHIFVSLLKLNKRDRRLSGPQWRRIERAVLRRIICCRLPVSKLAQTFYPIWLHQAVCIKPLNSVSFEFVNNVWNLSIVIVNGVIHKGSSIMMLTLWGSTFEFQRLSRNLSGTDLKTVNRQRCGTGPEAAHHLVFWQKPEQQKGFRK